MKRIGLSDKEADIFKTWLSIRLQEYYTNGYVKSIQGIVDIVEDVISQITTYQEDLR